MNTELTIQEKIRNIRLKHNNIFKGRQLEILKEIAKIREGSVSEGDSYISSKTKIGFKDKEGNFFEALPYDVIYGHWSPFEAGRPLNPDHHMRILNEIASSKEGRIKEGEKYINSSKKIVFIDKNQNEFKRSATSIKLGYWSPYESKRTLDPQYHFRRIKDIVESKRGAIKKGEKYISNNTPLTIIDSLGNEFEITPKSLKRGLWSPHEGVRTSDAEFQFNAIKKIVESRGGKIKEGEKYTSSSTKMVFIDENGYEFSMIPSSIKIGKWSPFTSKNTRDPQYHMNILEKIVKNRGGTIKKGEIYKNNATPITCIDQFGNEFSISPKSLKLGKWSLNERTCSENICREIIQAMFDKKFPTNWGLLKRNNGNRLQLDGYCSELKIAFEYQGQYHTEGWWANPISLQDCTVRDAEKREKCKDLHILLLEIQFYKNISNIENLVKSTLRDIISSYERQNVKCPNNIISLDTSSIKVDLSKISFLAAAQNLLKALASEKGGKIKEGEYYFNNRVKMTFIDKSGNEFQRTPQDIKAGRWSPYELKSKKINSLMKM